MDEANSGSAIGSLRERRIRNELRLLDALQRENPSVLRILRHVSEPDADTVVVKLQQTNGIVRVSPTVEVETEHVATIRFPRFYPTVPIEAALDRPVLHPNVHPVTGFVCLWARVSPRDTILEALRRLQEIICWKLVNDESQHVMNQEAREWYDSSERTVALPLSCAQLHEEAVSENPSAQIRPPLWTGKRRRLFELER